MKDVRTGSRVTTPVCQGGQSWVGGVGSAGLAPGNAAHRVLFVLLLLTCSAWFAGAVLVFRAQKHWAKLVWVMRMLCFVSSALQENLRPLREAQHCLCDL